MLDQYVNALPSFCRVGSAEVMRRFYGIDFVNDESGVTLHQDASDAFIDEKLKAYNMQETRPRETPAECRMLTKDTGDATPLPPNGVRRYQAIVGSLQWISANARPDVTFACIQLAKFNAAPTREHIQYVLCAVRESHVFSLTCTQRNT